MSLPTPRTPEAREAYHIFRSRLSNSSYNATIRAICAAGDSTLALGFGRLRRHWGAIE